MDPRVWILVAVGVFTLAAAGFNWSFFFEHRKARFFVRLFGRNGTRIFYALLGVAMLVLALLAATSSRTPGPWEPRPYRGGIGRFSAARRRPCGATARSAR